MTFDTTDYYDDTIGRTITAESGIGGSSASNAAGLGVVVQGIGRFVFANTGTNDCDFAAGLTVKDSATVAVKPGARPGRGTVTMNDTSTLEVAESGTVALDGNLTVADGAVLSFNFTDRATTPVLCLASGKTATASGTIKIKVSKPEEMKYPSTASGSAERQLTSGFGLAANTPLQLLDAPEWVSNVAVVDGDIVLTLKKRGFLVIVK